MYKAYLFLDLYFILFLFLSSAQPLVLVHFRFVLQLARWLIFADFFETFDQKPTVSSLPILGALLWTPKWNVPSSSLSRLMHIAVLLFCWKYF